MPNRRVAVFAFGTRGDVLPLAAVTAALAAAHPATLITFVTHAAHLNMKPHLARSGIKFVAISTPPVVPGQGIAGAWEGDGDVKAALEGRLREECVAAMEVAIGLEEEEEGGCVLINLFALEGWHLAELFRVPCAVLSPYVVPYSAPSSFERRFKLAYPLLYRRLREAVEGEVGWAEVMHWMWPLFTDRWAEWRTRRLRLSACPLTDPVTGLPLLHRWPKASPLLYGFSPQVVECPAYWPKSITVCGFWYAPLEWETHDTNSESTPINTSKTGQEVSLNPVPSHSPSLTSPSSNPPHKSLINIGPDMTSPNSHLGVFTKYKPPVKLSQFLSNKKLGEDFDERPIFIGLSSMGSMGFLERPGSILEVLEAALEATNSTAILLTAGHPPLDLAATELCDEILRLDVGIIERRINAGNKKLRPEVDNEKSSLDVGNEKLGPDVGSKKRSLDAVNEMLSVDLGEENFGLDVGNENLGLAFGNEKLCLDVGNGKLGNEKLCLDVGNENLGNKNDKELCLDVGNEKPWLDVNNAKLGPDVASEKLRLDVGSERPCLDVGNEKFGNKKLRLNVGNLESCLDTSNEKSCRDVGNKKACLDVGNKKPFLLGDNDKPGQDVGSRLHEGLTCFNGRLFCYSASVPYLWLLPQCSLALHHGGSGTTAACLRAGLPQIICPFVLDQFYWAERMAWLGVAPQPLRPEHLMPEEAGRFAEAVRVVAGAVREAGSGEVRGRARWLGEKVGGEDGVAAAVGILRSTFFGR